MLGGETVPVSIVLLVAVGGRFCVARRGGFATCKISALALAGRHIRKCCKRDDHKCKRKQQDVVAGFRKAELSGCGFVGAFAVRSVGCIGIFGIGG